MATATQQEIEDIRRKMALIRHDLHQDVRGVVEGAEAATDWRRYIRSYPWAGVGIAFAVGYFLVPRRHQAASTTIHLAPPQALPPVALPASAPVESEKKRERKSLFRIAMGLAIPLVIKAGRGYALQFAEQWLAQKLAQGPMAGAGGLEGLAAMFAQGGPQPGQPQPQGPQPHPGQPQGAPGRPPGGPRF